MRVLPQSAYGVLRYAGRMPWEPPEVVQIHRATSTATNIKGGIQVTDDRWSKLSKIHQNLTFGLPQTARGCSLATNGTPFTSFLDSGLATTLQKIVLAPILT